MINALVPDTVLLGDEDGFGWLQDYGPVPGDLLREWIAANAEDGVEQWVRRPEVDWGRLCAMAPELAERAASVSAEVVEQVVLETKYSGYIARQAAQVERFQRMESRPIPPHFDYSAVPQLRAEAKEKLARVRPASLGQASRISGISPADLAVLLVYLG